jgi:TrpR-related protein YerC/YecD
MKERFNDQDAIDLYEAILSLKDVEECEAFFSDLCTINELISMVQRYQVANMLDKEMTYTDIAEATSASTTTISRVNRALNYGANGYRTVIDRMKAAKGE